MTKQQRTTDRKRKGRVPSSREGALDLDRLTDEDGLFSVVKRLFAATPAQALSELFQNAQRAGARHVRITFTPVDEVASSAPSAPTAFRRPQPRFRAFTYADDGHGLQPGLAGLLTLLRLAASAYEDPRVAADQHPMGIGICALLALDGLERITVRSHDLALTLDPARWWDDASYRKSWPRLVTALAAPAEQVVGFALEVAGDPEVITRFADVLARRPGAGSPDTFTSSGTPAEGYDGMLTIIVDGAELDTSVRASWAQPTAPIQTTFRGNTLRVDPTASYPEGLIVIRWYGQLIFHRCYGRPYQAYLDVQQGRPLTPRAPAREGLVADRELDALVSYLDDLVFAHVCDPARPLEAVQPAEVTALLRIDEARAVRECPYVAIEPIGSLTWSVARDDEVDQPGEECVIRRAAAGTVLLLEPRVQVAWPDGRTDARGTGLSSFLTALGLTGYRVSRGTEFVAEQRRVLWWRPGPTTDDRHTTAPGEWGLGTATLAPAEEEWQPLPAMSVAGDPLVVFTYETGDGWSIAATDLFLGIATAADLVSALQRYGRAALVYDDEEDWNAQDRAFSASLDELIRDRYLGGPALPCDFTYADLQRLFPGTCSARIQQVTYRHDARATDEATDTGAGAPWRYTQPSAVEVRAASGAVVEARLYGDPT